MFSKMIGFTMFITGVHTESLWLILAGFVLVDLTPSFIKEVWRNMNYITQYVRRKNE